MQSKFYKQTYMIFNSWYDIRLFLSYIRYDMVAKPLVFFFFAYTNQHRVLHCICNKKWSALTYVLTHP